MIGIRKKLCLRRIVAVLLLAATVGCTGSKYYAQDRRQDNTDYANRISCPGDTVPVCFQRGGEVVHCRCENDNNLGDIF